MVATLRNRYLRAAAVARILHLVPTYLPGSAMRLPARGLCLQHHSEADGTMPVIPGSAAATVCITRPNSKSVWTMSLRFGHVFGITILAPDPKGDILKTFFSLRTHQKYDNVDDRKYKKIINYASKEWNWAKSKQGRFVELDLVDAPI